MVSTRAHWSLLLLVFLLPVVLTEDEPFTLSVIHINDFHARFDPVSLHSGRCLPGDNEKGLCYGGVARVVTKVNELKKTVPNPLLLNGGDTFQGMLFYNLFKWNISVEFMNRIPFDVTGVGNHEFDDGIAGAVPYFENLESPLVAANMNASLEPNLQDKFYPSITIGDGRFGNHTVGIIGCISQETPDLANSGKLIFYDELGPVRAEAARLRSQGVDIIILLSHSGYDVEQMLAEFVPDLDIIVGAHSHTFLYTGKPLPSREISKGDYPTVVRQQDTNRTVLIVQAYAFSKYVGELQVQFDVDGEIVSWSGQPHLLDHTVPEDPETKTALQPWADAVNKYGNQQIGVSHVLLSKSCKYKECNLGSFICDGFVYEQIHKTREPEGWTKAAIAIIQPGALRTSLGVSPNVLWYDLLATVPFNNTVDTVELQGKDIVAILERSAAPKKNMRRRRDLNHSYDVLDIMQVSGIHVTYNMSLPGGSRIIDLKLRCSKCQKPEYRPVVLEEWYNVVMQAFLSRGGDGYHMIPENGRNLVVGDIDVNILERYIKHRSPITQLVDGRIKIVE